MGARDLIEHLHAAGIRLTLKPPDTISAQPRSALTDDLRELIRRNKPVLVAALAVKPQGEAWRYGSAQTIIRMGRNLDPELFEERAGILEYDAGYTKAESELLAALDVLRLKGH